MESEIFNDTLTKNLKKFLDYLFLFNPFVTTMGFMLGMIFGSFLPVFNPIILQKYGIDISQVPYIAWVLLGVFLLNAPSLFFRRKLPKEVEDIFILIERARRAGISDIEIKQKYRALIQTFSKNVVLNKELQQELKELKQQVEQDNSLPEA